MTTNSLDGLQSDDSELMDATNCESFLIVNENFFILPHPDGHLNRCVGYVNKCIGPNSDDPANLES